jgi:hypothetical protein
MTEVARPQILFSVLKFRTSGGLHSLELSTSGIVIGRATLVILHLCPSASIMYVEHLEFFICRLPFWSYYYFWFTAATIYFWCSNTSRDVSHTSSASDDLENVGLAFGILLVPLAVLDLLLLAIVDGRI